MGILTTLFAYQYGKNRASRSIDLDYCDHCGFHRDLHEGRGRKCPDTYLIHVLIDDGK